MPAIRHKRVREIPMLSQIYQRADICIVEVSACETRCAISVRSGLQYWYIAVRFALSDVQIITYVGSSSAVYSHR